MSFGHLKCIFRTKKKEHSYIFSNDYQYRKRERQESAYNNNDNRYIIINKLINDEYNYICFDCKRQTNGLKYFDVKNAVFLCYNNALEHTLLPKEISEVMSGDIRTLEERYLLLFYYGGNKFIIISQKLLSFT